MRKAVIGSAKLAFYATGKSAYKAPRSGAEGSVLHLNSGGSGLGRFLAGIESVCFTGDTHRNLYSHGGM